MNSNDFVSLDVVLAEIANKSGDKKFKYASKGEFLISIQEALSELALDTLFFKGEKVYDLSDGCLNLKLPQGAFNIRDIFGYNGDDCNPQNRVNIYSKPEYKNGLSKNNWNNESDPFYKIEGGTGSSRDLRSGRVSGGPPSNLYYAGYSNGILHLSSNCSRLQKVSVRFNTIGSSIGEKPVIPILFKVGIVEYSVLQVLTNRLANNPIDPAINTWIALMNIYTDKSQKPYTGSWDKAMSRAKNLDMKTRNDYKEYFAKIND